MCCFDISSFEVWILDGFVYNICHHLFFEVWDQGGFEAEWSDQARFRKAVPENGALLHPFLVTLLCLQWWLLIFISLHIKVKGVSKLQVFSECTSPLFCLNDFFKAFSTHIWLRRVEWRWSRWNNKIRIQGSDWNMQASTATQWRHRMWENVDWKLPKNTGLNSQYMSLILAFLQLIHQTMSTNGMMEF